MTDREVLQQTLAALDSLRSTVAAQLGTPLLPPNDVHPAPPPPPPPAPLPSGNPGAVVPPWGEWNQVYPGGFPVPANQVLAFPVPAFPPGRQTLNFRLGQMPGTPPRCHIEIQLSRTPGVIDPAAPGYWSSDNTSYNGADVPADQVMGAQWYVNVRASAAGRFSVQWS